MKKSYAKWFKNLFIFTFFVVLSTSKLNAQTSDSIANPEREFKNTIRFNVTNPLIFGGKSLILVMREF